MAMGRDTRLLLATLLLLTLAKGNNYKTKTTCTASDLEIQHHVVHMRAHEEPNSTTTTNPPPPPPAPAASSKLNQTTLIFAVWVLNHCVCMVDNVVIWAPNGFSTVFSTTLDPRVFSKISEHLYLLNDLNEAGPLEPAGKNNSVSAFFSYPWYSQIELKPASLVSHC